MTVAQNDDLRFAGPWNTAQTTLHTVSAPTDGWEDITIGYRTALAEDQPPGSYEAVLTFTAVAAP